MNDEKRIRPWSGWIFLPLTLLLILGSPAMLIAFGTANGYVTGTRVILTVLGLVLGIISLGGYQAIAPNQARVMLLFGVYKGSVVDSGFYWVNPFYTKKKISMRIRNFETGSITTPEQKDAVGKVVSAKQRSAGKPSKVNDRDGNPIEISAVVVWRVVNTAEALFEVDDFEDFVAVQSEAALRNLAMRHPYDNQDHEISLRGSTNEVCDQLKQDIQERLGKAGVEVIESRISHLAYAPEIASAMLQRQQAAAVVAARTTIVDGAVGMVEMALEKLSRKEIVVLDEERRAAMVSNLLVVLCGDRHAQPVINTGSLYQ